MTSKIHDLKISHYLMILFISLSIMGNTLISITLYHAASTQVMVDIQQRLHDIVFISASTIDGDLHETLVDSSQQKSLAYLKIKTQLQKLRDSSSDIHFVYTMAIAGKDVIRFVVDAETGPDQMAKLGEIYHDASPLLRENFSSMDKPVIENQLYRDKWGSWLSGYAPFYDGKGKLAGVLGMDISATTVKTYQKKILLKSLLIFMLTLPVVIMAALWIGRRIGMPMVMLQKGALKIAGGDLDIRLAIPKGREISVLAETMNHMAASLQEEQQNLKQMALKYKNIFENASEGIFQTTPEGSLLTANSAMVETLGYTCLDDMQQGIEQNVKNLYEKHEDRKKITHLLEKHGHINALPVRMKRKNGSFLWVELNVHLCRYDNGEKIIEGTLQDITQRLEKEKADREKDAAIASSLAKSEFLANMSHEIRTPMNAVMGLTDLVMRTELSDIQRQYLKKITTASKSLLAVINDILDFSKIEAGRLELEHANFSIFDLMSNISEMFAFKAEEKGLEFLVSIDENTPGALIGDQVRLGQVLINLVGNAIKFTERGEIVVQVKPVMVLDDDSTWNKDKELFLEFSVKDTGTGIPGNRLDKLFDSFTQADSSTTRKYGGTGLGLSISRQLVGLMGGEISVTSQPSKGSCFYFTVRLELQPKKDQPILFPPRDLRGLNVLIVDDNKTSLEILSTIIKSFQMEAVTACSGDEAIKILTTRKKAFDLVLMDWKMPRMNGIETARKVKLELELEKMPIICMVSAHAREDLLQQADKNFLDAFLHKPVNQSLLFDTIMELFGRNDAVIFKNSVPSIPKEMTHQVLKGKTVLLVEDNEINREVALEWLNSAGMKTTFAVDGKKALKALSLNLPDAVLMDIQMPEMDGFEATRHIRNELGFKDLPVIAMTAHALKGDREKCLEAGMDDYITKPIDPNKLFSTLAKWMKTIPEDLAPFMDINVEMNQEAAQPFELPGATMPFEIPGIDVKQGLFRANNNLKLYKKLLKTFIRDFAETDAQASPITLHSIKGVSANIGADLLSAAAADVETCLALSSEKVPEAKWDLFSMELNKVVSGIEAWSALENSVENSENKVDIQSTKVENDTPVDPAVLLEHLKQINAMLDEDLNTARQQIESVEADLRQMVDKELCQKLMEHIDNFEIDETAEIINKIINTIEDGLPG